MDVGEKCNYKLKNVVKYMFDKKNNYLDTVSKDGFYFSATLTLTLWNLIMAANFTFVPETMQMHRRPGLVLRLIDSVNSPIDRTA